MEQPSQREERTTPGSGSDPSEGTAGARRSCRICLPAKIALGAGVVAVASLVALSFDRSAPSSQDVSSSEAVVEVRSQFGVVDPISYIPPSGYFERRFAAVSGVGEAVGYVLDTPEHRAVFSGEAPGREGPTEITIMEYPGAACTNAVNPMSDLIAAHPYRALAPGNVEPMPVGSTEGFGFSWSGLYEAESVAVESGCSIYLLTVTFLTPEDPILADFERMIASVRPARP